jgi:preprotein translocase subunit YajC
MSPEIISILYIVGLFALLYFFLIRPQQVRQKKHAEMIKNLKPNDPVITVGGIYGTIVRLREESVTLKVAENIKIEVLRSSIAQVRGKG